MTDQQPITEIAGAITCPQCGARITIPTAPAERALSPLAWALLSILRTSVIESTQTGSMGAALEELREAGCMQDGRITAEGLAALRRRNHPEHQ